MYISVYFIVKNVYYYIMIVEKLNFIEKLYVYNDLIFK